MKGYIKGALFEVKVNHSVWKAQAVDVESVFSWCSEYSVGECNDVARNPTIACDFSADELIDHLRDAKSR
jgi:hypothetical protein